MKRIFIMECHDLERTHWWHITKKEIIGWSVRRFHRKDISRQKIRLLEIGAGSGNNITQFLDTAIVTALDSSKTALNLCRNKGVRTTFHADIERFIPPKHVRNYFDVIIAADVLEHLKNDERVVQTLTSMLRTYGILVIHVPANPGQFSYWDSMMGHVRRYDPERLSRLLRVNSLTPRLTTYRISFLLPFILLYRKFISPFTHRQDKSYSDFRQFSFFNTVFLAVSRFENFLIKKGACLPFGTSLFIVAEKV